MEQVTVMSTELYSIFPTLHLRLNKHKEAVIVSLNLN